MILGHDFLGLGNPKWDIKQTIAALPQGVAVGCFDSTWQDNFGDPYDKIKALCKSGKVVAVRVQLFWSYAHTIVPLDVLKKATPRWEKLAKEFKEIKFYLSPSCEYRWKENSKTVVTKPDLVERVNIIKSLAPSCTPVLSPWEAPSLPGVITEHHGMKAQAKAGEFVSYDGGGPKAGGFDEEMAADEWMHQNRKASIVFGWSPIYNCAESHNALKPNKRSAYPSGHVIKAIQRLMEPRGKPVKRSFPIDPKPLKKPQLWKQFAEDMQGENPRDNKPLFVVKASEGVCYVIANNGKEIARLALYGAPGSFEGGLSRYYSGFGVGSKLYGYEIAEKAKATTGTEFVYLKVGKQLFGPLHPAFRTPYYR